MSSSLSPPLKRGFIQACFQLEGKQEVEKEEFMMLARGGAITGLAHFKMEVGIVSDPVFLLVWKQLISFRHFINFKLTFLC